MANPPYFKRVGTTSSGTGAITVTPPTVEVGDYMLLLIETDDETANLSTPGDFADIGTASPISDSAGGNTRLTVYGGFASSASPVAPVVADPGDHVVAAIATFGGVNPDNPINVQTSGNGSSTNTHTLPGVTTTVDKCLVLHLIANGGIQIASLSAPANAGLLDVHEFSDFGTSQGNDGGAGGACGIKETAGATGDGQITTSTSVLAAYITLALEPVGEPVDETAPEISNVSPADGGDIRRDTVISLDVTDESGLAYVGIHVAWTDEDGEHVEVAYDGTDFRGRYVNSATTKTAIAGGFRFKLRRSDGWPVDASGNVREISFEYPALDTSGNLAEVAA